MTDYYDRLKGPLSWLTPFFFDYETLVTDEITLKNMTLRQYLQRAPVTALAACIGHEEPQVYMPDGGYMPPFAQPYDNRIIEVMRELATRQDMVWVAHNAAFDVRVAVDVEKCPWPKHVWCNMEGAMGSWPELPGGYSLHNVTETFCPPSCRKFPVDLKLLKHFRDMAKRKPVKLDKVPEAFLEVLEEVLKSGDMKIDGALTFELLECALALYNKRDVVGMRHVYYQEVERVSAFEQRVALRTHQQRKFFFEIDQERLDTFVDAMANNADYAALQAQEYLSSDDLTEIFNSTGGNGIQSVRYQRLKRIVNEKLSTEEFTSTSKKKISPVQLARNPKVAQVLEQTAVVGKMISHKRRSQIFRGVDMVHMELGYARAHTGRFSSPGVGSGSKGLNIHNVPKHAKEVAKPLRQIFRLPRHLCFVRGDFANLEFRVEGILTKAVNVMKMFDASQGGDINNDPYCMTWKFMTGMLITKKDPVRQVAKCLAKGTKVVTNRGNVPIEDVTVTDKVFDGEHWVSHGGSVFSGLKDVVCVAGIWMTLDHLILVGPDEWREAWELCVNTHYLKQAIAMGLGSASATHSNSPINTGTQSGSSGVGATSQETNETSPVAAYLTDCLQGARGLGSCSATSTGTPKSSRTGISESAGSTATAPSWAGATTQTTRDTTSMGPVASALPPNGRIEEPFSAQSSSSQTGMPPGASSTGSITMETTSPETSALPTGASRTETSEPTGRLSTKVSSIVPVSSGSAFAPVTGQTTASRAKSEKEWTQIRSLLSKNNVEVRTSVATYDVTDAGPRTRYLCDSGIGPMLMLHNSATLGLGFAMQVIGYAQVILKVLADKDSGVTEKTLRDIIIANSWGMPPGDVVDRVIKNLGCSQIVAISSYHIHRTFNMAYPEFTQAAKWIVRAMGSIATCGEGAVARDEAKRLIDQMYLYQQDAPDRDMIGLEIDNDGISKHPVVRVRCGPYPATVCWREPYQRLLDFKGTQKKTQLSILKSTDMPKGFSPQLAIENVTQAASRNGVCEIVENLDRMGYPDCIHIHDEILLIVPREREAVLKARDAIIKAAGPTHGLAFGWGLLIKPDEITVTESLWEDEDDIKLPYINKKGELVGNDRWGKIERNEPNMFEGLL